MTDRCAACGAAVPADARFCASCGTAVSALCRACGAALPADARFCPSCGAAREETTAPAPPREERKVVSAMFADLAGFTAHTERSDPEDVRARLTTYHRRVREDVERFGGRVEKLMGDGVFAVFGVPAAHEDDPERAVRAALRIQESVADLNKADPALSFSVRVAVTTGEAMVQLTAAQDHEGVVGDVVNTASRLQQAAPPGGVVVDERTFLASRAAVVFEAMDPVTVKGKADPIALWQAMEARSRYGVAIEEEPSGPFVGRGEELSLLIDAFERTVARRAPQLVTVAGEPGVGKSRLLYEFRRAIDDRPELVWWRQGRCLPLGEGATFWSLGEIVKAQAGILESEPPESADRKLRTAIAAVVTDAEEAEWLRTRLAPLAGSGGTGGAERAELFSAWHRFFEALAARNPLVMVIEDLHWADDALAEFIQHLLDWGEDAAILVVCTARPELFDLRPGWGGGRRDAVTISLTPLSDDDTLRLVASLTERRLMPAEAQRALLERSGGNPLYVTELMHWAAEHRWFERADRQALPLPDSVQAVIAGRLDLLDVQDKPILQAAAVVGKVFWAGAVAVIANRGIDDVRAALRRMSKRELVRPVRRSSMQGQEEYVFGHVLVRDVAYGQLPRGERARLHEEVAGWIEAVSGERVGEVAELLAHHVSTAIELRPSDAADRLARAYRYDMLAGERTKDLDAGRSVDFFRRAAGFARLPRDRARALLELGRSLSGRIDEAAAALDEAVGLFAGEGDREGQADALAARGTLEWYRGDAAATDRLTDELRALTEGMAPSESLARALGSIASKLQLRGSEEEALEVAERAIRVAQEVGSTTEYARALVVRGSALAQLGEYEDEQDVAEALRIYLDRNDTRGAMVAYNNHATFLAATGRVTEGLEVIEEAIEFAAQRGNEAAADWSRMTACEALFPLGEWDRVIAIADDLLEADRERGGSQVGAFAAFWRMTILFWRGSTAEAHRLVEEGLAAARDIADPQGLLPALAAGAVVAEAAGDVGEARRLCLEFAAVGSDHPGFLALHLPTVAPTLVVLGMADRAAALAAQAIGRSPWLDAQIGRVRALVDAARGDHELALPELRRAIEVGDELSQRFGAALTRIEAARSALALGLDTEAAALLEEARSAAEAIGAVRLLDAIEGLLRERGAEASGA